MIPASARAGDGGWPQAADHGRGGLPVVLVHGLAGDRGHWEPQLEHLARRRRVVAIDLRGHGASPPPADRDYTVRAFAGDVASVVDRAGLDRFVLCGHSFGAAVIGAYAGAHTDRVAGLLLVDPVGDLRRLPRERTDSVLRSIESDGWQVFLRRWYERLLLHSNATVRRRVLDSLRRTSRDVVLGALRSVVTHDPTTPLDRCRAPRLAIVNADLHGGPETLHRVVESLPHRAMSGVGHWLMLDRPDEFNAWVDEFLGLVEARS
jgi:pimeloyl-ACP methyl ester carboxylesterase